MQLIYPNWPVKKNIIALTTTRMGGISKFPYYSLNLASHVGDNGEAVQHNRQLLRQFVNLPSDPVWLNQTHSNLVINLNTFKLNGDRYYDGSYTSVSGRVCVVLSADCLPVLFYSRSTDEVAASHAGWRGLSDGILENTVHQFHCDSKDIVAWLGPAIGPTQFEVGENVKNQFEQCSSEASAAFLCIDEKKQKYLANIYMLARQRLNAIGVVAIFGGDYCTMSDSSRFFSYRRERVTGRIASLIWIKELS